MTQYLFQEASYVTFDLLIPRGTSLGLYGRRNSLPTHTHHNFMEVISGLRRASEAREARSAEVRANVFPFPLLCVQHNTYFYKCFKLKSTEIRSDLVAMLNFRLCSVMLCLFHLVWGQKNINSGLTKINPTQQWNQIKSVARDRNLLILNKIKILNGKGDGDIESIVKQKDMGTNIEILAVT